MDTYVVSICRSATSILVTTAIVLGASSATAEYEPIERVRALESRLKALRANERVKIEEIKDELGRLSRGDCKSLFDSVTVKCLSKGAREFCGSRPKACLEIADLAAVNILNSGGFISKEEKFEISQSRRGYATEYERTLRDKYALLATEYLFGSRSKCGDGDTSCLASSIDAYCARHSPEENLPWQACVSAIVWFVGTK
ncbi:MAG: hypothetical protein ABL958_09720 [Bdellovibrionia bacterium]